MRSKKRNPFRPFERAMEMEERSNIDREESKARVTQQQRESVQESQDSDSAGGRSEQHDSNQPKSNRH